MKKYIFGLFFLNILLGCHDVGEYKGNLSTAAICTKRAAIEKRRENYQSAFLACMNTPKRIQTVTDDESDMVVECRITAAALYDTSIRERDFMSNTDVYIQDCSKIKQGD